MAPQWRNTELQKYRQPGELHLVLVSREGPVFPSRVIGFGLPNDLWLIDYYK